MLESIERTQGVETKIIRLERLGSYSSASTQYGSTGTVSLDKTMTCTEGSLLTESVDQIKSNQLQKNANEIFQPTLLVRSQLLKMMTVRLKEHHQPLKMVLDHRKCPLMMK